MGVVVIDVVSVVVAAVVVVVAVVIIAVVVAGEPSRRDDVGVAERVGLVCCYLWCRCQSVSSGRKVSEKATEQIWKFAMTDCV